MEFKEIFGNIAIDTFMEMLPDGKNLTNSRRIL